MPNRHFRKARQKKSEDNWPVFWLLEVLILSVPLFFAVASIRKDDYLRVATLALVAATQLGLTLLNLITVRYALPFWLRRNEDPSLPSD